MAGIILDQSLTHLGPLITDGETAEHPGCHPRLGRHIVPAHGLWGGEPLVSIALNTGRGVSKYLNFFLNFQNIFSKNF